MRDERKPQRACAFAILACIVGVAGFRPVVTVGHEGHAPLPSKGVTVAGNNILLSQKACEAIGLTTVEVTLGDLHRTIDVNANVELPWDQQAMITSLVSGRIEQVLVRPGESVIAGQELARIASMELESLHLALMQAVTEVDLVRRLVEHHTTLSREGAVAGKGLLEAQSALAEKMATLRIAEQKLHALGLGLPDLERIQSTGKPLRYLPITSPIPGVITHADLRVGQMVEPTDHLYHVVDPSRVWIVGEALEADTRHLHAGQSVTARFASHPNRPFRGQIDHVRLKMDRRTRTQSVVILVDNRDGQLRPGMSGRISVVVQVAEQAIVCPADAILKSREGKYVLVERSARKFEKRPLKLGLQQEDQIEVLNGVFPSDKVVVNGAYLLASLLGREHKARTTKTDRSSKTPSRPVLPVAVAYATIELPTSQQTFATPRIEGRIRHVLVKPSTYVKKGQILAEVDSLELRTAQLDLLQRAARLRLARQTLARLAPLATAGTIPRRGLWELKAEEQRLANHIASLKRRLAFYGLTEEQIEELERTDLTDTSTAEPLLENVPVRAPESGWIVAFNIVPGQVVHPHDQLFEIHDLSKVWVKGYVFEQDAAGVTIDQPALVTFAAFPSMEANGRVVRMAPVMEESERVLPVWVEVENSDRLLKEGMQARVVLLPRSQPPGSKVAASSKPEQTDVHK